MQNMEDQCSGGDLLFSEKSQIIIAVLKSLFLLQLITNYYKQHKKSTFKSVLYKIWRISVPEATLYSERNLKLATAVLKLLFFLLYNLSLFIINTTFNKMSL